LDYIHEKYDDVLVVVIESISATIKDAVDFKQYFMADIDSGWKKIIVDLADCNFIDSTFLGVFVVALKKLIEVGGDLRLVGVNADVHSMFQLSKWQNLFETFETMESLIKSYKVRPYHFLS
jgi:anti-anti-sigma factor